MLAQPAEVEVAWCWWHFGARAQPFRLPCCYLQAQLGEQQARLAETAAPLADWPVPLMAPALGPAELLRAAIGVQALRALHFPFPGACLSAGCILQSKMQL